MDRTEIQHGWDVYGADGEKVGDVAEVQGTYIVVSKGFLFKSERYVPVGSISRVEHDRVYLSVTKDEIEARGWDRVPEASGTIDERRERTAEPTVQSEREPRVRSREDDRPARREGGERIELREEELRARKEPVQTGEVGIRKEVVEEEKTLEVPRMREEVEVERRPVDRRPTDRPVGEGAGETVGVPVHEERVSVEKQPVVTEEVEVSKRPVQGTERVSDTVRREEVRTEGEGDVNVRGDEPRPRR